MLLAANIPGTVVFFLPDNAKLGALSEISAKEPCIYEKRPTKETLFIRKETYKKHMHTGKETHNSDLLDETRHIS